MSRRKRDAVPCCETAVSVRLAGPTAQNTDIKISDTTRMASTRICGACERELPDGSYSEEQRGRRQSSRRCDECVAAGNQLVLMKKGRTRSEEDDCPLCQLPLSLDPKQSSFRVCCMKLVCGGCVLAAKKRGMDDCPFCRAPIPEDASQTLALVQKRADAGDPMAIYNLGDIYVNGDCGLERDVMRAFELYERASDLGLKEAHFKLGCLYGEGTDVEKDTAKAIQHFEASAAKGDVRARYCLGILEHEAGNYDLALQHYMIAAKMGYQDALDIVKSYFIRGLATKTDYAEALRGHQSAAEEMRSPDREEALAIDKRRNQPAYLLR